MGAYQFNVAVNCPPTITSLSFIDQLCKQILQYLKEDQQTKLCFAIHEGLINAIESSKETEDLKFCIQKKDDFIEVEIINYGEQIPKSVIEKATTLSFEDVLWDEHGRGLLIINTIADEWSISRDKEGRNVLKIKMAG